MKNPIVQIIVIVVLSITVVKVNELLFNESKENVEFKIGFVETNKLMLGFSEANKANKEFEMVSKEFETNLKALQDSVQAQMDFMSKEFDKATDEKKLEMQKKLRKFNDDLNRYQQFGMQENVKKHQEKMTKVYEKVNTYIEEYSKDNGYSLILGSTNNGSILYGKDCPENITNVLVKGLNLRYQ